MNAFKAMVNSKNFKGYCKTVQCRKMKDKILRKNTKRIIQLEKEKCEKELEIREIKKQMMEDHLSENSTVYAIDTEKEEEEENEEDGSNKSLNEFRVHKADDQVILDCGGSDCDLCFFSYFGEKDVSVQNIVIMNWKGDSYKAFDKRPFEKLTLFKCDVIDDDVHLLDKCSSVSYIECTFVSDSKLINCTNVDRVVRK